MLTQVAVLLEVRGHGGTWQDMGGSGGDTMQGDTMRGRRGTWGNVGAWAGTMGGHRGQGEMGVTKGDIMGG